MATDTKIIALFNQAGGQGKSTLTLNLGYHLAERGYRVLLIDMDGQATLTRFALDGSLRAEQPSIYDCLVKGHSLPITKDIHGIDFVISDERMYRFGRAVYQLKMEQPVTLLYRALEEVKDNYDYILIDCPPDLDMGSENALVACTQVMIPLEPVKKGLEGFNLLYRTIQAAEIESGVEIQYAGLVPMKYDSRIAASVKFLGALQQLKSKMPIYPAIPQRAVFLYASDKYLPVALLEPKNPVVSIFREIVKELERL